MITKLRNRSIDITIKNDLGKIQHTLFNTFEQRILMATVTMHGKVVRKLSGKRSGKIYPLPQGGEYQASAPNEAPAVRLADLRTSINFKVKGQGWDSQGFVGSPLPYARRLEHGFVGRDRLGRRYNMAKRPYIKTTFKENQKAIERFFKGLV